MHAVVMESLEEYLAGTLEPADTRRIEEHLNNCPTCRQETREMREVSFLFGSLRSEENLQPSPGFYGRVMETAGAARPAPSLATLFGFDLIFARRLAFASLLTFAVLGSYLISRETAYAGAPSPEAVLAQQDSPAFDSAPAPDNMLVTLTAYEH
jgi:anti-sigma factor RsiW